MPTHLQLLGLAIAVVIIFFLWGAFKNFDLWDEGFLWYGVQRVMLGEVPIRDFMAYDPGRYYWSALIMRLLGSNGIIALRISLAMFQTIGVFAGLTLISREAKNKDLLFLLISAAAMVLWMTQFCKIPDYTISIITIYLLAGMIRNPNPNSFFLGGVGLGLAAIFGRNHGLYGIIGHICAFALLSIGPVKGIIKKNVILMWSAGIVVGFMPVFLMALFVRGFADAFWTSILFLFHSKSTNLALPIPWPWKLDYSNFTLNTSMNFTPNASIYSLMLGLMFISLLVFGILSACWVVWKRHKGGAPLPSTFVAASLLSLPYAHYAFSRAEAYHLGMGIYPFLIGILVLLSSQTAKIKWPTTIVFVVTFLWVPLNNHAGWASQNNNWVEYEISGSKLIVPPEMASTLTDTKDLIDTLATDGKSFLVVPYWPGIYAVFNKKSPTWEIFPLWPRSSDFEKVEIQRIKSTNLGFILVWNYALDGRPERQFKYTHPLTYKYITENFSRNSNVGYLFELYTPKVVHKPLIGGS